MPYMSYLSVSFQTDGNICPTDIILLFVLKSHLSTQQKRNSFQNILKKFFFNFINYWWSSGILTGFPWWLRWWRICLQCRRPRFDPWVRKIHWRKKWLPIPVFLPGAFNVQRSLEGPWGPWKSMGSPTVRHIQSVSNYFS